MGEYTSGGQFGKAAIHNEKDVTPDYVLKEANTMWKKASKWKVDPTNSEEVDGKMAEMRRDHPEFCQSYPIVLRYMVQFKQYSSEAFRIYLKKIQNKPWKNENEYLDSQADYVVILYQKTHKNWNSTQVGQLRRNIREILQKEHDHFKMRLEQNQKVVEADEERIKFAAKDDLAEMFRALKARGASLDEIMTLGDQRLLKKDESIVEDLTGVPTQPVPAEPTHDNIGEEETSTPDKTN